MALPVLEGENIILRQLRLSDAASLASAANDKRNAQFIPHFPYPYSLANAKSWIRKTHRLARKDAEHHFVICDKNSGQPIGMIGLKAINRHDLNAEVGYWVGRRFRNRGLATEAMAGILRYLFFNLHLRRVYAILSEQNVASIKVLEKAGFTREAVWRKATRNGRKWFDVLSYGLLKEEFHVK